jgi:hypothetical protein
MSDTFHIITTVWEQQLPTLRPFVTTVLQIKMYDFSGETSKGFEVL